MNPYPLFKAFAVFRELLGAILSFGVLVWLVGVAATAILASLAGRMAEFEGLARSLLPICLMLGAAGELGGRLITWPLRYEIEKLRQGVKG
jgi:hypothetical protein